MSTDGKIAVVNSQQENILIHDAIQSSQFLKGFLCGQIVLFIFCAGLFHFMFFIGPFELRRRSRAKLNAKQQQHRQQRLHAGGPEDASTSIGGTGNKGSSSVSSSSSNGGVIDELVGRKGTSGRSVAIYREILQEFNYNPSVAEAETCKWANIMFAQVLGGIRNSAAAQGRIFMMIEGALARAHREYASDLLRDFQVTSVHLGSKYPNVCGVKVNYSESGRIRTDFKLEWSDEISIGLEGLVAVNWPVDLFAGLPFQLSVLLVKMSGVLSVEFPDFTEHLQQQQEGGGGDVRNDKVNFTNVQLTFLHDATFELDVKSVIGHMTKLKDMSKVATILTTLIRNAIEEEIVWPNYKLFEI